MPKQHDSTSGSRATKSGATKKRQPDTREAATVKKRQQTTSQASKAQAPTSAEAPNIVPAPRRAEAPKRAPTVKGRRTRSRIFQAAIEQINRRGYEAVSIPDICTAAGVSVGNFYHHFQSKSEIILEYVREESRTIAQCYTRAAGDSISERLTNTMRRFLEFYEVKGKEIVAVAYAQMIAGHGTLFDPRDFSLYAILSEAFAEGQRSGEFRSDIDRETALSLIVGMIWEITIRWTMDRERVDLIPEGMSGFRDLLTLLRRC